MRRSLLLKAEVAVLSAFSQDGGYVDRAHIGNHSLGDLHADELLVGTPQIIGSRV